MEPVLRTHDAMSEGWTGLVLLGVLMVLAWTNVRDHKKWAVLWDSVKRLRLGQQTMRDDISLRDRGWIALQVAAMLLVGLFVHQWTAWGGVASGWSAFLVALGGVVGITAAQLLLIRLTGWFFVMDSGLGEYLYTCLLLFIAFALLLLPVSIVAAYLPAARNVALVVGAGILVAMVVYRWFRAAVIGLAQGVGLRAIFIYICALEILPAALAAQAIAQHARSIPEPV